MRRTVLAAVAATLTLAACGSHASTGHSTGSSGNATTAAAAAGASATFNDADVTFAQSMIPHHEQAIEMAELALDPKASASAKVKELATRIKGAQDPEINQMKTWLTARSKPTTMDTSGGHDMSNMAGMMPVSDMDALAALTGKDFDKSWLDMMIAHHTGAITMAETEKAGGADAEMKKLADDIIAAQQKEITEMKALVGA